LFRLPELLCGQLLDQARAGWAREQARVNSTRVARLRGPMGPAREARRGPPPKRGFTKPSQIFEEDQKAGPTDARIGSQSEPFESRSDARSVPRLWRRRAPARSAQRTSGCASSEPTESKPSACRPRPDDDPAELAARIQRVLLHLARERQTIVVEFEDAD